MNYFPGWGLPRNINLSLGANVICPTLLPTPPIALTIDISSLRCATAGDGHDTAFVRSFDNPQLPGWDGLSCDKLAKTSSIPKVSSARFLCLFSKYDRYRRFLESLCQLVLEGVLEKDAN